MPTIDADAHVIECDGTWKYVADVKLRPLMISPGGGRPQNWLIDGRVFHRGVNFDSQLCPSIFARCATSRADWNIWTSWRSMFKFSTRRCF